MNAPPQHTPITNLRLAWICFALLCLGFLLAGFLLLSLGWHRQPALRWAAISGLMMIYPLAVLGRNLDKNYRKDEMTLLPDLGLGNWVSLLRGMLVAGLTGFLLLPWPPGWLSLIPAVLYGLCLAADGLDGSLARRANHATRLGSLLDISFDGLGVLVASLLLIQYGQVPAWYILVGLARYIFLAWEWVLPHLGQPVQPLPRSMRRRIFATLQFIFIAVLLIPLFKPPVTWTATAMFALPFLISFGWDMLLVGGFVKSSARNPSQVYKKMVPAAQVGARLLVFGLAAISLWQALVFTPPLSTTAMAIAVSQALAASLVLAGVAARISSGFGLVLIGLGQIYSVPFAAQSLLMAGYVVIIYLGSGSYSIFPIEEYWYQSHPENRPEIPPAAKLSNETLLKTP